MPDRVLVEILVAAPIETVWKALREPVEICRWFGWNYPRLAEEIDFIFVPKTLASDADHTLRFGGMPDCFTLEANGKHTIVRLIRSAPVTDPSWQGVYDDVVEGWLTFTEQLRFVLERHHHQDRLTLYLNGRAKAAVPLPAQALGLDSVMAYQPGTATSPRRRWARRLKGRFGFARRISSG